MTGSWNGLSLTCATSMADTPAAAAAKTTKRPIPPGTPSNSRTRLSFQEAINLVIRRRFSGELLRADGEPKSTLREEGVYSVNKRNELLWTLTLKPGEERKLTYRYTVLVVSHYGDRGIEGG